jgi:tRNA-Thr(GGU) m(6)t(6)A37 methyltransferase TsaA
VTLEPIGSVESPYHSVDDRCDYRSESRLVLRLELAPALVGLEYFSHLWVIYRQHRVGEWLHRNDWGPEAPLVLPADDHRAGQGIFSTRAPCRPAGLGSCIVALHRREENVLVVRGLDALDGTPLIDVKPYVPHFDAFPDAAVPLHWAKVMDQPDDAARLSRELHWDTSSTDFTLGLRVGVAVLARLGLERGQPLRAELGASALFAQGFEAATGCSPLRGTLAVLPRGNHEAPWSVRLPMSGPVVEFRLPRTVWSSAAEILGADEPSLWDETGPRCGDGGK